MSYISENHGVGGSIPSLGTILPEPEAVPPNA
jgi:hypothetical protein